MTDPLAPEGVGRTAIGVAGMRADEHRRPDRLFTDPYAEAFVAAAGFAPSGREPRQDPALAAWRTAMTAHVALRTRFYDDFLRAACAAGCRQVVLLAAGLDTRAFRLRWPPGVRLYEVDLPEVLDFKRRVLEESRAEPRCARTVVAADLRADWTARLTAAGFATGEPAAWLVEGLLIYLTAEEAAALLGAVGDLAADGSRLSFEHRAASGSGGLLEQARDVPGLDRLTRMWKGGLGAGAADWLAARGWRVEIAERARVAASYGRPLGRRSAGGFLTAVRDRGTG